jgi:hypothetical protein
MLTTALGSTLDDSHGRDEKTKRVERRQQAKVRRGREPGLRSRKRGFFSLLSSHAMSIPTQTRTTHLDGKDGPPDLEPRERIHIGRPLRFIPLQPIDDQDPLFRGEELGLVQRGRQDHSGEESYGDGHEPLDDEQPSPAFHGFRGPWEVSAPAEPVETGS